jgi:hypothetical protein
MADGFGITRLASELWRFIRTLFSSEPGAKDATFDEACRRTAGRVVKFVLRLYYAGYDPTIIARVLVTHAIEFVIMCGGSEIDPEPLNSARATLDWLLIKEHSRRRLTPPYDAVARFQRRKEWRS